MSRHRLFTTEEFIERATEEFDTAMADLQKTEWRLRDALDDLDRLTA